MAIHRPIKRFGQNFLIQPAIAQKIVASAEITNKDTILEIGPGPGALTGLIVDFHPAAFYAIEIDSRWAGDLVYRFGSRLNLLREDFLKTDLNQLFSKTSGPIKILGNIPYNITSPIVFKILEQRKRIASVVLMVQLEVAQRIVAMEGGKNYGALSVMCQVLSDVKLQFKVAKGNFNPVPRVDSAVIRFFPKKEVNDIFDLTLFRNIVRTVFNYRRKMLHNGLNKIFSTEIVSSVNSINLNKRPEQISVSGYKALSNEIFQLLKS